MTPAGIHLRAHGFLRDGSLSWLLDLNVDDLREFRMECARIRAERSKQYDHAVDQLAGRLEREWVRKQFEADQAGPATPLSEVLP